LTPVFPKPRRHRPGQYGLMRDLEGPKATVVAAYAAANRGDYSAANALVAPEIVRALTRGHAQLVKSDKRCRATLARMKARRDEASLRSKKALTAVLKATGALARLKLGSPRSLQRLWDGFTHKRSLVEIQATRQVIRGRRGRVYLKLTFSDGTVLRDNEPVVLRRGKWLLG
jgi:hypothetical protein